MRSMIAPTVTLILLCAACEFRDIVDEPDAVFVAGDTKRIGRGEPGRVDSDGDTLTFRSGSDTTFEIPLERLTAVTIALETRSGARDDPSLQKLRDWYFTLHYSGAHGKKHWIRFRTYDEAEALQAAANIEKRIGKEKVTYRDLDVSARAGLQSARAG